MKRIAPALAAASLAALVPAQVQAQAAAPCLTEAELADAIVYATPAIVAGVRGKCAKSLAPGGFLSTKGTAFAAKYAALQPQSWPTAKTALITMLGARAGGGGQGGQMLDMVGSLPDQSLRPLVDGMLAQQVGEKVRLADCARVERAMQLSSVMAPRDNAALMAFVIANSGSKDVPVCRTRS